MAAQTRVGGDELHQRHIAGLADRHRELIELMRMVGVHRQEVATGDGSAEVRTVLAPDPDQSRATRELFAAYMAQVRIVLAFLRRVDVGTAARFAQAAERLSSYFLLRRQGGDIPFDLWKELFTRESAALVELQARLIADNEDAFALLRDRTPVWQVDFELSIARGENGFRLDARSPLGSAGTTLKLDLAPGELENFVLAYCGPKPAVRQGGVPRALEPLAEFGGRLFAGVFRESVRDLLQQTRAQAVGVGNGLRVRLRLAEAAELQTIPWELLYDGTDFLCLSPHHSVVRHLDRVASPATATSTHPLRVLVTVSSPRDLPRLDTEAEIETIRVALGPLIELGLVELSFTRDATLLALQRTLRRANEAGRPIHIWHFMGHGHKDAREGLGMLDFERDGKSAPVSGFHLGTLFRNHPQLRLVFLNACETGAMDQLDAMSSLGGALVERGVPTAVTMQFPISDDAAVTFTEEFYASLVDGLTIDAAVTEARRAIFFSANHNEWATPAVFARQANAEVLLRAGRAGRDTLEM
ncbi:CHAT domain-containing protein [Actinomadura latina]|uniref:CHAT domain-containing protein n=1 Tax=Actinomadura latina TaxID=163603 RepID=A0A846Z014_9ACTN|nr:CHAT domain-containing protein [Actinomadura latina]NKZ05277.1 CHAT domain-containing protein [Actinomadura latina]